MADSNRSSQSAIDCGFNWSAQHRLGFRDATASACQIVLMHKIMLLPGHSHSCLYSLGSLSRVRKAMSFKPLSVRMDGVASTG